MPAAMRELYEETGIRTVSLLAEASRWINYDLPAELIGIGLKGKFRGQTQRWFAFRFEGDESEIAINPPPVGTKRNSTPGPGSRCRICRVSSCPSSAAFTKTSSPSSPTWQDEVRRQPGPRPADNAARDRRGHAVWAPCFGDWESRDRSPDRAFR